VHDSELTAAVVALVGDAGGIDQGELTAELARLYGWARRRPDVGARLDPIVVALLADGTLTGDPDALTIGAPEPTKSLHHIPTQERTPTTPWPPPPPDAMRAPPSEQSSG